MKTALLPFLCGRSVVLFFAPIEIGSFLFFKEDVGGVVIDARDAKKSALAVAEAIRKTDVRVPIALLSDGDLPTLSPSSLLGTEILKFEEAHRFFDSCLTLPERKKPPSGFFLSETSDGFSFSGYPVKLPPIEKNLLRFLLYRYPKPTSTDLLLSFCSLETPVSAQRLYAHLSHINSLAAKATARPIILHTPSGYSLRDGVV